MSECGHDFVVVDEVTDITPAQYELMLAADDARRKCEVLVFAASRQTGKSVFNKIIAEAMIDSLRDVVGQVEPTQMQYGPPRLGKRGKVKRW